MRVMITGHRGYIGTVMVPMVQRAGHEVVGLDSDLYRNSTYGKGMPEVDEIIKDIRDIEKEDLRGVDAIVHLAGLSNDVLGDLNPELTYDINHKASVRMAEMAKEVGIRRFVFASSCSNYGAAGNQMQTEEGELHPVTAYAISKVRVEHDLALLADDNFSPVIMRNATAYGVSPRIRFDIVLNNLTAWAFTTGEVHLKSDGSPWRPIVHVDDIARAYVTTKFLTSGSIRRIIRCVNWRILSAGPCRIVKSNSPMERNQTREIIGWISRNTRRPFRIIG